MWSKPFVVLKVTKEVSLDVVVLVRLKPSDFVWVLTAQPVATWMNFILVTGIHCAHEIRTNKNTAGQRKWKLAVNTYTRYDSRFTTRSEVVPSRFALCQKIIKIKTHTTKNRTPCFSITPEQERDQGPDSS